MPNLGVPELLIIALVLVLLFGAKKLPEMARGVGRSLRIFKAETAKLRDDDDDSQTTVQAQPAAQSTAQPQPAPPQQIQPAPAPALSAEEQARRLEEQAARLRANAQSDKPA
ncbi:Sec-independent protein translocase subunit TatA [Nonomuraea lactucae]|uniref:Sec-independent protein translocase subunit TatA n=1 Tax=Nonomuraea lactucae TaxID=2249762 RepID=UPI000DE26624|nr:Sec-independent protein translocase subunit TatA [Nonomuraea lactucae]